MTLKTSTLLLAFSLFSGNLNAQVPDENNIYYRALIEYTRYVDRFEPEVDTLYFEELKGITSFFPKQIKKYTVVIITALNQQQVYEANGGKLIHRKMTPAQVKDDMIDIGVIPYQGQFSVDQGGLRLGLSKWHSVLFGYNSESNKFEYKRIENN